MAGQDGNVRVHEEGVYVWDDYWVHECEDKRDVGGRERCGSRDSHEESMDGWQGVQPEENCSVKGDWEDGVGMERGCELPSACYSYYHPGNTRD